MYERQTRNIVCIALLTGGLLGMAGSFVTSAVLRGLFWGIDGIALVLAGSLLTLYYFRKGADGTAAGFLIFSIGQALILSSSGIDLSAGRPLFAAGTGLWSTALFVVSAQRTFPGWLRGTGLVAAVLFAIVAILLFVGGSIHALTRPLPFFAYPFLVITLFGWAWTVARKKDYSAGS